MIVLLHGCTSWTLIKHMEKKLNRNYTKQQLYGYLPPILETFWVRWVRHAGHCWKSKKELLSDILLWTPPHGHTSVGWPAKNLNKLSADIRCNLVDLPSVMDDRDWWQERIWELSYLHDLMKRKFKTISDIQIPIKLYITLYT